MAIAQGAPAGEGLWRGLGLGLWRGLGHGPLGLAAASFRLALAALVVAVLSELFARCLLTGEPIVAM